MTKGRDFVMSECGVDAPDTCVQPMRVLSLGGGTQSCALALMSAAGELPKLDHIVFADTQGELPETYEYLDYLRPIVENAGIPLHIVTAGNLEQALLNGSGTSANPTPPAHMLHTDGSRGRIGNYKCSYDFKRRQVEKKVKQLCGGRGVWKCANVEQWIGYSLDEMKRMKLAEGCRCGHNRVGRTREGTFVQIHTSDGCTRCRCATFSPWQVNRWPLIELEMKRDDTIRWFTDHGHPVPPRSACWFCPNSGNARWRALRAREDNLWERACTVDEAIRDRDDFHHPGVKVKIGLNPRKRLLDGQMFLHAERVPLRVADLRSDVQRRAEDEGQYPLFDEDALAADCDAGVCFT
jgi:hypothetical protein